LYFVDDVILGKKIHFSLMDNPLYTFEPFKHTFDTWLFIPFVIALSASIGIFFFNKNKILDTQRRNVVKMLLGFVIVIAIGMGGFRLISQLKLKTVKIYSNQIETPYGKTPLSNIRDYYIKMERRFKPINPDKTTDSTRYFFILEKNDKTHVLSEGDYQIDSILAKLNEAMGY
jgi:hypothetical protein